MQGQQDEPLQHRQYLHHEHPALRRDGSSLSLISMLILVLYFRTELIISYWCCPLFIRNWWSLHHFSSFRKKKKQMNSFLFFYEERDMLICVWYVNFLIHTYCYGTINLCDLVTKTAYLCLFVNKMKAPPCLLLNRINKSLLNEKKQIKRKEFAFFSYKKLHTATVWEIHKINHLSSFT
jgi:hypothetical protein